MDIFVKKRWTVWGWVIILHGLLLGTAHGVDAEKAQLKNFSEQTEAKNEQEVKVVESEIADVRLLSAQLLYNKKADNLSAVLQTAFDYIDKQRLLLKDVYRSVVDMEIHVEGGQDIGGKQKELLLDRLRKVKYQIERDVSIPSIVARRGGLRTHRCKVLAVNKDLDAVILDAGYTNGISPGSKWQIRNSEGKTIKLQVVEVRRTISAAVPDGVKSFAIETGQSAERAKENTLESKENYGN